MRLALTLIIALTLTPAAGAQLVAHYPPHSPRSVIHHAQLQNLAHARFLCKNGRNHQRYWGCKAELWLAREAAETAPPVSVDWASKQIAAAEVIGRESHERGGDPWPHCPDPFDGGGSWSDTVRCENSGSWLDSPGYFRCGLQFDPAWERRFGRLCP